MVKWLTVSSESIGVSVHFVPHFHLAQSLLWRISVKPGRKSTILSAKRIIYNLLLHLNFWGGTLA